MMIEVDWMDGWANCPYFVLSGAPQPAWPLSTEPAWESRDGVHRADAGNGYVAYFYSDGRPTHGFGGAAFRGTFVDGRPFDYEGAWSSRAGVVNARYPESPIVDVTLVGDRGGRTAVALTAQTLIDWWREHRPSWGLAWVTEADGERTLQPTRGGDLKPTIGMGPVSVEHVNP